MSQNKDLLSSLQNYLSSRGALEESNIAGRCTLWYDNKYNLQIMLPAVELIEHKQSFLILNEAIEKIATTYNIDIDFLKRQLGSGASDFMQVRSAGSQVNHGSIRFSEGLKALNGLYQLIKSSASKNVNVKGKAKAIDLYLSGVNMLAPEAGSFIYNIEINLINPEIQAGNNIEFEYDVSFSRYLNTRLAKSLALVSTMLKGPDDSVARFYSIGVDLSFCKCFLNVFSPNSDELSFSFDWSFTEKVIEETPTRVVFDSADRLKIEKIKEKLIHSVTKEKYEISAVIEKYSWPVEQDTGRVYIRVRYDGREYSSFIEVSSLLYERLKAERAKKEIYLLCDFLVFSASKTSIDIVNVHKITIDGAEVAMD